MNKCEQSSEHIMNTIGHGHMPFNRTIDEAYTHGWSALDIYSCVLIQTQCRIVLSECSVHICLSIHMYVGDEYITYTVYAHMHTHMC